MSEKPLSFLAAGNGIKLLMKMPVRMPSLPHRIQVDKTWAIDLLVSKMQAVHTGLITGDGGSKEYSDVGGFIIPLIKSKGHDATGLACEFCHDLMVASIVCFVIF